MGANGNCKMSKTERETAENVVREMIAANPSVLNVQVGEEVSRVTGKKYDAKYISRIRNGIGLGMYQQLEQRIREETIYAPSTFLN